MSTVSIKYIGRKPLKQDNVADTGLVWAPGEVLQVAAGKAKLLLRFPDVWEQVDGAPLEPAPRDPRQLSNPTLSQPELTIKPVGVESEKAMLMGDQAAPPQTQRLEKAAIAEPEQSANPVPLPPNINSMTPKQLASRIQRDYGIQVDLVKDGQPVSASVLRAQLVGLINRGSPVRG